MKLSLPSFRLKAVLVLCGGFIYAPSAIAQNNIPEARNGCNLSLALSVRYSSHGDIADYQELLSKQAQARGYTIAIKNWDEPRGYGGETWYYLSPDNSDFMMASRVRYEDDYRTHSMKAEVQSTMSRRTASNGHETIWEKISSGAFTCVKWKGWATHYQDLSEHWLTAFSGTYSAITEWLKRCDDHNDPYEFVAEKMLEVLIKQLNDLPTCEAAKNLPGQRQSGGFNF